MYVLFINTPFMVESPYVHITHWCLGDCQRSAQCNYCSEVFPPPSLVFFLSLLGWGFEQTHKKAKQEKGSESMHTYACCFSYEMRLAGYSSLLKVASNSSYRNKRKEKCKHFNRKQSTVSSHIHTSTMWSAISHELHSYIFPCLFIYSFQIELEIRIYAGYRCFQNRTSMLCCVTSFACILQQI